ncbi:MAG: AAA family ATPase, partial [Planctomycetota bacterium]
MSSPEEIIQGLREAVSVSPNNVPLRKHLAQSLVSFGFLLEAETEYRETLKIAPNHFEIKLGLAQVLTRQNKSSQAIVIMEDVCSRDDCPADLHVEFSRILLDAGEVEDAVSQYKQAIDLDPECRDDQLGERLGVGEEFAGEVFEGMVREAADGDLGDRVLDVDRPKIKFADVGGMIHVKEEIAVKILHPIQQPEIYEAYGKKIGGGILMYGPPGCGKTYLARATAGEIGAGFISVGISDVLDMWMGNSERNLSAIFEQARSNAPCVLFFDEVDALGSRRTDMQGGSGRNVINLFLSEMDGVENSNDGVLILAATNAPWHVDPAFRRPGRFD